MAAVRRADSSWEGDLISGSGVVSASTSKAFSDLPVTWASRTESAEGRTSPEELLAAAHAACYSMAFSGDLAKAGSPPTRLDVSATVTFDKLDKWTVVSSALTVRGGGPRHRCRPLPRDRGGRQGRLPDLTSAPGQRQVVGRSDPPELAAATLRESRRRGLSIVSFVVSASDAPAARRRGRNVSCRYV